jgi:hypothetical protein
VSIPQSADREAGHGTGLTSWMIWGAPSSVSFNAYHVTDHLPTKRNKCSQYY